MGIKNVSRKSLWAKAENMMKKRYKNQKNWRKYSFLSWGFVYYPLIHRRRDYGPRLLRHAKGVPPFPISGKSTPRRLLRNRGKVGGVIELRQHDGCSSAQEEVCIIFKRNEAEWLMFYFNTFIYHSLSYKRLFLALREEFRILTGAAREKTNRPI